MSLIAHPPLVVWLLSLKRASYRYRPMEPLGMVRKAVSSLYWLIYYFMFIWYLYFFKMILKPKLVLHGTLQDSIFWSQQNITLVGCLTLPLYTYTLLLLLLDNSCVHAQSNSWVDCHAVDGVSPSNLGTTFRALVSGRHSKWEGINWRIQQHILFFV